MFSPNHLKSKIFSINTWQEFENLSVQIFNFQYKNNLVYHEYVNSIERSPKSVKNIKDIPFLPIEFFKTHKIICGKSKEQIIFLSSGTTGINQSKHFVLDTNLYKSSFLKSFKLFYGSPEDYCIFALLPNYLEKGGSSLVYMVNELIAKSKNNQSGFFLNNYDELLTKIEKQQKSQKKILLIGVSYALLDISVENPSVFENVIIMETGGMKGRRKEMTKKELHEKLSNKFEVENIHSEYGMTELLSQAYSLGKGIFNTPPWMKILIRDTYDPFHYLDIGRSGGINVIDLANIESCSFIETKDIGKCNTENDFEVLGRFDNSDIRGCNLLIN